MSWPEGYDGERARLQAEIAAACEGFIFRRISPAQAKEELRKALPAGVFSYQVDWAPPGRWRRIRRWWNRRHGNLWVLVETWYQPQQPVTFTLEVPR